MEFNARSPRGYKIQTCVCVLRDLRFIEVVENVCQRLLEYNLHKERTGSNRFAKVSVTPPPFVFHCRSTTSASVTCLLFIYFIILFLILITNPSVFLQDS